MDPLNFYLALCISFLGVPTGIFIANYTKEEFGDIERFITLTKLFLTLAIFIITFIVLKMNLAIAFIFLGLITITLFHVKISDVVYFSIFAVIFYASSANQYLMFVNAFLIFVLGMISGTLIYISNKRGIFKDLLIKSFRDYIFYILISTVFYVSHFVF